MHVYRRSPQGEGNYLYTVGYYAPQYDGGLFYEWVALKDYITEEEAARAVNYLNGGPTYGDNEVF